VDRGFAVATLPGHTARLNRAALNPKADRVAVGGTDNTVRIRDTETGRKLLLIGLEGSPTGLVFGARRLSGRAGGGSEAKPHPDPGSRFGPRTARDPL
jgi:WD40 repeat protein